MSTAHAEIETPCFMPVGTRGAVKGVAFDWLEAWDCRVVLANTYHLMTRPGPATIEKAGGLHAFMGWPRAILTDSGPLGGREPTRKTWSRTLQRERAGPQSPTTR